MVYAFCVDHGTEIKSQLQRIPQQSAGLARLGAMCMVRQEDVSLQFYQNKLSENAQSLVFSRLADCFRKKGEIQEAIGVCTQGLAVHPHYVTGRVILGRCYLEQEKLKEAIAEFVRVIELDRRNPIAVKMVADIYARQGMKEKAADLYSYLLRMDPENQSLIRLANAARGTGETNVLKILGISSHDNNPVQEPSRDSFDGIDDMDKTIQMDLSAPSMSPATDQTSSINEMLIKTQEFDPSKLGDLNTVKNIGAPEQKQAEEITGDDVSSRMSMLFGDEGAEELSVPTTIGETPNEVLDSVSDDQENIHEETTATSIVDDQESAPISVVSGNDISSRLEQLFGEEPQKQPEEAQTVDVMSDFTQAYVPGPAAKEEDDVLSASNEAVLVDPPPSPAPLAKGQDISGEDVTERLNEMFSDDASSIEAPLAEIGKLFDMHSTLLDEEQRAASEKEDEQDVPQPVDAASISGDDVASRLESIFEDGDELPQLSEDKSAVVPDLPGPDNLEILGVSETEMPVDTAGSSVTFDEHRIMIGGDSSDEEIHSEEATLLGGMASAPEEKPIVNQDGMETNNEFGINETVAADEQPQMSGDDVVGRLDELFSDKMLDAGSLDSIPDGEKEEGEVNQGFYTMSGENAQTSGSEEIMLSELYKQEDEGVEKTVVLESDDVDDREDPVLLRQENVSLDNDTLDPLQNIVLTPMQPATDIEDIDLDQPDTKGADDTVAKPQPPKGAEDIPSVDQYSIPDHVLTPTLADIYFQQGQPALALQIYNRILKADPDNEEAVEKIRDIQKHIDLLEASQEKGEQYPRIEKAEISPFKVVEPVLPVKAKRESVKQPKKNKPLTGVRIKKVYKNRIKKTK